MSNTNVNFTLKFAEHKMEIVFNPAEDAQWVTFGGNGKSWQSAQFCNAVGEKINVNGHKYLLGLEPGLYLTKTFEDVYDGLAHPDNFGYAISEVAKRLLSEGTVTYRTGEILPHRIYGFGYDGVSAYVHMLNPRVYEEDEPDSRDHVRNAYILVRNMEDLRKAEAKGVNIRLIYTEKQVSRFELMKEQWALFLDGKYDELAENIQLHVAEGAAKKELRRQEGRTTPVEEGQDAPAAVGINQNGETCDLNSIFGLSYQFVAKDAKKGWVVLPTVRVVDNPAALAQTLKRKGYRFMVASQEVTDLKINHVQ